MQTYETVSAITYVARGVSPDPRKAALQQKLRGNGFVAAVAAKAAFRQRDADCHTFFRYE
jgi:hypothetical protein